MFIGREYELSELNRMYNSSNFEFAVIYGRRRIGKSTLIQEFGKEKEIVYYMGIEGGKKDNIAGLADEIFKHFMPGLPAPSFENYDQIFDYVDKFAEKRFILAIDEFPYLAQGDPSISSIIQRHIDTKWKNSKLMLILCGSSMSFMENQVLGYKSPLYGRRTSQLKLQPFRFNELQQFNWNYSAEDTAIIYAITGGIAEYLSFINPQLPVKDNILNLLLRPAGRLYEEPSNLLKQELRDPLMYNSILNSIASGNTRLNDIATKAGEPPTAASFHLKSLTELGIISKITPAGAKESTRKSQYVISDSFFAFWYGFVYENQSLIASQNGKAVYDNLIAPKLNMFMGRIFENLCIQYMLQPSIYKNSPFAFSNIGHWWGTNPKEKRQEEIDVCAMDNHNVLLGECKWTNAKIDQSVLNDLYAQGELFPQENKYYYLFSKNGFTNTVISEAANNPQLKLITLEEIWIS